MCNKQSQKLILYGKIIIKDLAFNIYSYHDCFDIKLIKLLHELFNISYIQRITFIIDTNNAYVYLKESKGQYICVMGASFMFRFCNIIIPHPFKKHYIQNLHPPINVMRPYHNSQKFLCCYNATFSKLQQLSVYQLHRDHHIYLLMKDMYVYDSYASKLTQITPIYYNLL